ncbi:succinyl-CoA synthetase subunit alpha [Candidatus Woesearchaeota archaeon]|nr:succinyl-CoA synthetase subunit alpha [Candidatus Woesearchaeota archaeon]
MISGHKNYEWFIKKDMSTYSGKWVIIINEKIISSGNNIEMMIKEVKKKYPNKTPFITKVRDKLSIL